MTVWSYITGTDTGFGLAAVKMLAAKNQHVFAGYLMDSSREMLAGIGATVVPVKLDVTSDESVAAAAEEIKQKLKEDGGALGGLVNNAGLLFQTGPADWTPITNWQKMLEVNVLGPVRVTNSVMALLRESEGRIVNTASIAGRTGLPTQAAYCASKHAIMGYSESLRREVAVWGITVHIVEPGVFVQTGLYRTYYDGIEKLWSGCSEEKQSAYGTEFKEKMQEGCMNGLSALGQLNTDASIVPKAYLHALTSSAPQYRYRCGWDSKVDVAILSCLPDGVADMVMRMKMPSPIPLRSSPAVASRGASRYARSWVVKLLYCLILLLVINLARRRLA